MNIKKQLQTNLKYSFGKGNSKDYITIHQTGNYSKGANAQAHANLQSRLGVDYSWHWQVDDKEAIQSYSHDVKCWHAGDGKGKGNTQSIGIEICVNPDSNYKKAIENGARLTAKIMKDENISISKVVQHNYWSGKDCPHEIRKGKDGITWDKFLQLVKYYLNNDNENDNKLYKVQVGAFKVKKNAIDLLSKLKSKGFDGFIKVE